MGPFNRTPLLELLMALVVLDIPWLLAVSFQSLLLTFSFTGSSHDLCVPNLLFCLLQGHWSLDLGSIWIIQDVLNSRSLIYMCKDPFPNNIIVIVSRDLDKGISFGATI